jgi:predicted lysophospholipase L1 biosynthesis ABC-type transport system permease subunit
VFLIHSPTKAQAIAAFRKTRSEIVPTVPLVTFVTLREQMDAALGSQELITLLANFFGVLALLLSALGLYGLLSAGLAQRTSEIGVRVALGATRGMVLRMVLKEALRLLALGLLLGAMALFFTTRFVSAMLHGVSAYDPSTLVGVAATLVVVTILAAMVPALRAATLDPEGRVDLPLPRLANNEVVSIVAALAGVAKSPSSAAQNSPTPTIPQVDCTAQIIVFSKSSNR